MKPVKFFAIALCLLAFTANGVEAPPSKVIVYSMPDGSVCVITVTPEYMKAMKAKGMTEDKILNAEKAKRVPAEAVNSATVNVSELPQSRRFRAAWRWTGAKVDIDIPAARAVRQAEIKEECARRLKATDAKLQELTETNADTTALKTYRAALRQIRDTIDCAQCKTTTDLEAFKPNFPKEP